MRSQRLVSRLHPLQRTVINVPVRSAVVCVPIRTAVPYLTPDSRLNQSGLNKVAAPEGSVSQALHWAFPVGNGGESGAAAKTRTALKGRCVVNTRAKAEVSTSRSGGITLKAYEVTRISVPKRREYQHVTNTPNLNAVPTVNGVASKHDLALPGLLKITNFLRRRKECSAISLQRVFHRILLGVAGRRRPKPYHPVASRSEAT